MKNKVFSKNFEYFIIIILQIFILFSPEFRFIPKSFPKITWVLSGIGLIIFFFNKKLKLKNSLTIKFLLMFLLNYIVAIIVIFLNSSNDYSYISYLLGTILCVFRVFLITYFISKTSTDKAKKVNVYLDSIIYTSVIYVCFTILFILFPDFKNFWLNNIVYSIDVDYYAYIFRYSLNGFAAFASSTIFSIVVLLNAYLLVIYKKDKVKFNLFFMFYIINILGCFFYGRVAIVAILFSIVYLIICFWNSWSGIKLLLRFTFVSILGIILLNFLSKVNINFKYWTDWAFGIIKQFFSSEGITDHSFTHMFKDMYFMPSSKTFIFGDGMYTNFDGTYYLHTDVGYMRNILYYGIIGTIIYYSLFFIIIFKLLDMYEYNRPMKYLLIFLLFTFFVLEMKGESLQRFITIIMPLYYLTRYKS